MKKILYLLAVAWLMLAAACQQEPTAPENSPKQTAAGAVVTEAEAESQVVVTRAQFEATGMQLGQVQQHDFSDVVRATGYFDVPPQNRAKVSTFMGGYIARTTLLEGDKVQKGQVLATLRHTLFIELQQQYLEAFEQLQYLQAEFERQQALSTENINSQKSLLKSRSEYKTLLARKQGLEKKLLLLNLNPEKVATGKISEEIAIYAPVSGYIIGVNAATGMFVAPEDVIFEIVDTSHLHLELSVFEKDILKIEKGQHIRFRIPDSGDGRVYTGEVHLVGRSVEGENRTVRVHGHLRDEDAKRFVTGMYAEAEIVTSARTSAGLPTEAVVSASGQQFILVKKSERNGQLVFKKTPVQVRQTTGNWAELVNFPASAESVLVRGAFNLLGDS